MTGPEPLTDAEIQAISFKELKNEAAYPALRNHVAWWKELRPFSDNVARAIEAARDKQWREWLGRQEPIGFMWQHDETGRVGFADEPQRGKWEEGNPRLHIIGSIFLHPAAPAQPDTLKSCGNCRHLAISGYREPCSTCIRTATDNWEPRE